MLLLLACTSPVVAPDDEHGSDSAATTDSTGFAALADLGARNIVFVHVDTLRKDHLPFYGSERDTLPRVGGYEWLVVDGVHADTSWTVPSTISVLTGLDDLRHGFTHMTSTGAMSAPALTDASFAERLHDAGYATAVLSGNNALPLVPDVFRGFDVVDPVSSPAPPASLVGEVRNVLPWIDSVPASQPFFAFLQPMNVHLPYQADPAHVGTWSDAENPLFSEHATEEEQLASFTASYEAADVEERERLVEELGAVYDEALLGVDDGLAELIDGLAERGLAQDTLIVVAADHGETLADEPAYQGGVYFGHGGRVRQELVRVPFMIYHPSIVGEQLDCLAQNTDLLPTILEAVGLEAPADLDGHALQDGCRSMARSSTYQQDTDTRGIAELMVSDGAASLRWVCEYGFSLRYDLESDPTGIDDIPEDQFPQLAVLGPAMEEWLAQVRAAYGDLACRVPEAPAP